jgi:enoyl-CoA hydratase
MASSSETGAVDATGPHALIDEQGGIITVTFNRPAKLNAISPEITDTLWRAVEALAGRSDLRAMVITGTGRYFTAGIDLKLGHRGRVDRAATGFEYRYGYRSHHRLYDEIEQVEKPVIIAANGPCLGAGTELAASCDFRFCTPDTYFGLPEIRLGVIPGSGGVSRLTRLVGTHWAKWMALAGRNVHADQAKSIALVHDIFPDGELPHRVHEFAVSLTTLAPEAVALAKLVIDLSDPQDREKTRHVERLANTDLVHRGAGRPATDYRGPAL